MLLLSGRLSQSGRREKRGGKQINDRQRDGGVANDGSREEEEEAVVKKKKKPNIRQRWKGQRTQGGGLSILSGLIPAGSARLQSQQDKMK